MKHDIKGKWVLVLGLLIGAALYFPSQAYAWGRHDRGHDYPRHAQYPYGRFSIELPHGSISVGFGHEKYYYHSGLFYRQHQREYIVVPPPSGVVVYAIPQGFNQVVIDGAVYYTYNGVYYTRVSQGYQVIQPPAAVVVEPIIVSAPPVADAQPEQFTINIPKAKNGYRSVIIKRSGTGFIGPQGEFYDEFPKIEQLKVMYGK